MFGSVEKGLTKIMVLPSQIGSSGSRGRYMSSRRRSRPKWPWIAAVLLVSVAVMYLSWLRPRLMPVQDAGAVSEGPRVVATIQEGAYQEPVTESQRQVGSIGEEPLAELPSDPPLVIATDEVAVVSDEKSPATESTELDLSIQEAVNLLESGQRVQARAALNQLLGDSDGDLSSYQAQIIRDEMSKLNEVLIFSPRIFKDDQLVASYIVKAGEYLGQVAPRYGIPYQFVEVINGVDARRLSLGRQLKVVNGPFHVVVSKSQFRLDVFLDDINGAPVYIRSFPVGLGADDSTPVGRWVVRAGSKQKDPAWTSPTGVHFASSDPKNPIGKYWIGLRGDDEQTQHLSGYGIHGTVEPQTIGKEASLGCIRLYADDIELIFAMLVESKSTVVIIP